MTQRPRAGTDRRWSTATRGAAEAAGLAAYIACGGCRRPASYHRAGRLKRARSERMRSQTVDAEKLADDASGKTCRHRDLGDA
jgi:hypothetical protein